MPAALPRFSWALPLLFWGCAVLPNGGAIGEGAFHILGTAQDGGRPQMNCTKECCAEMAKANQKERVAALGVRGERGWMLVDATPDAPSQVAAMAEMPAAILLTHAHIGHYLGLAHLGREAAGTHKQQVWCSNRMAKFLRGNGPWNQLVELGQIELRIMEAGVSYSPIPGVSVVPFEVPHRDEYSDTFAFSISAGGERLFYVPDIDAWDELSFDLIQIANTHDTLLLDGTFFSDQELPGRDMSLIPHPRVGVTMDLLEETVGSTGTRVLFTHFNHTNPLWQSHSPQSREVRRRGFGVAQQGTLPAFRKPEPDPIAPVENYRLVWSDEFDGSEIDFSKWEVRRENGKHGKCTIRRDCSVLDGKGNLVLTTRLSEDGPESGMISTDGFSEWTYGLFEARIQFEKAPGHHGAFWLQSDEYGKVKDDLKASGSEIDICEYFGVPVSLSHNIHWNAYQSKEKAHVGMKIGLVQSKPNPEESFRTYSYLWTPTESVFFVDGKETWRTQEGLSHHPEYIILSVLVSEWESKQIIPADFPDSMLVDWVRVFQLS
ncbi:MAG TPA: MBL fold metallo-hydrolase [Planctomycetota bacterium]|nr:MBL fold metallo-hydrolase [Planctomycetota bacterium]